MYAAGGGGGGNADRPTEFYHGTSLESILAIQATGFRLDLAGSNAGAALDSGVYITTTLEKALNYAKGKPSNPNPAGRGVPARGGPRALLHRALERSCRAEGLGGARVRLCLGGRGNYRGA